MNLLYLETVDSTNKYAKEHLSEIKDKTLVFAEIQTAGRGRLSRKWDCIGQKNLYASIVLKPSDKMQEVYSNLTQYLCVILTRVFKEYNVDAQIKWPNDIRINKKKISGILAEAVTCSNGLDGIILGFGVNLNCLKDEIELIDQPATSLNIEAGMEIDRETFLKRVIKEFCLGYNRFIEEGFLYIREDYKKRAEFLNKFVTIKVFDKEISGIAVDITENGALKLVDTNDNEHILLIGDIL